MAGAIAFSIMQQETPRGCVVDIDPPVGGAITVLANNPDGSLKIECAVATDLDQPVTYNFYLSRVLADLFDPASVVARIPGRKFNAYQDALEQPIVQGETYYAAVRASDAFENLNQNTTSLSVVSTGLVINSLIQSVLQTFIPPGQSVEVEVNQAALEIETNPKQQIKIEIEGC